MLTDIIFTSVLRKLPNGMELWLKLNIFRQDVILVSDGKFVREMFADSVHGDVFNDRPTNTYSKHITYGNKSLVFGPANPNTSVMRKIYLNALNLSGDGNDKGLK